MVAKDADALRHHEGLALEGYLAAGRESEAIRARQAFVLALMLAGDYATAREQQEAAIAAMRRRDSHTEVADSQTLLSSILFRLGLPRDGWREMSEALRFFAASRLASGTARAMVVAAIIDILHGDPERGARIAGVTYELSRAHNVMLAPITVLHMPDPRGLAAERLGADRTAELLEIGAATPLEAVDRGGPRGRPGEPVDRGHDGRRRDRLTVPGPGRTLAARATDDLGPRSPARDPRGAARRRLGAAARSRPSSAPTCSPGSPSAGRSSAGSSAMTRASCPRSRTRSSPARTSSSSASAARRRPVSPVSSSACSTTRSRSSAAAS